MDPAKKKVKPVPKATLRWVMTLGGTEAVSGMKIWTARKAAVQTAKMTNNTMTCQSFHS